MRRPLSIRRDAVNRAVNAGTGTMTTLLARNATLLVTMDGERRELRDASLFARDGMIEAVGPTEVLPRIADEVLDLSGQIVLPGLVNCHHHLDQVLTRNLPGGQNT